MIYIYIVKRFLKKIQKTIVKSFTSHLFTELTKIIEFCCIQVRGSDTNYTLGRE